MSSLYVVVYVRSNFFYELFLCSTFFTFYRFLLRWRSFFYSFLLRLVDQVDMMTCKCDGKRLGSLRNSVTKRSIIREFQRIRTILMCSYIMCAHERATCRRHNVKKYKVSQLAVTFNHSKLLFFSI